MEKQHKYNLEKLRRQCALLVGELETDLHDLRYHQTQVEDPKDGVGAMKKALKNLW